MPVDNGILGSIIVLSMNIVSKKCNHLSCTKKVADEIHPGITQMVGCPRTIFTHTEFRA